MKLEHLNGEFIYRVVGVAIHEGCVLAQMPAGGDSWSLPGGKIEFFETSSDALKREMREELGIEVNVGKLLWVNENFFEYEDMTAHQLGLYFAMTVPSDIENKIVHGPFVGYEDHEEEARIELIFKWCPLDQLDDITIYPVFLRDALKSLPTSTQHVVCYNLVSNP